MKSSPSDRARELFDTYTRDLSPDELQRLFTDDPRDAYRFFTRGRDDDRFAGLPLWKSVPLRLREFFIAFTLRLSPARRILYVGALVIALAGIVRLFRGFGAIDFPFGVPFIQVGVLMPVWADGTLALLVSLFLVNLLMLLEVADRLSLKGELEVAREIQLAMLPKGTYRTADLPLGDGRVIVTLGDVAGKGSPAALLMALLLAVLRTLVDEDLDAPSLVERLNVQICRHSPSSRFITLFYAVYSPVTGSLTYVNAGQNPPMIRRLDGRYERLGSTGVALGMFEQSCFASVDTRLAPGETLVLYSDGITEAEDPSGSPFEEAGLESVVERYAEREPAEIAIEVLKAVEAHAKASRFIDDLTILLLKRARTE